MKKINVIIYGATGSIGDSFFSVARMNREKFNIEAISCNKNLKKATKLAKEFNIKKIAHNRANIKNDHKHELKKISLYDDLNYFDQIVSSKTNVIIFAISGLVSLNLLIKLLKKGKTIGLANKECIISLGNNLIHLAKKYKTKLVPLDSEHNSIYHLLSMDDKIKNDYSSITITASGGPFLDLEYSKFRNITVKQALKHPIWKMGKKITIDSSTMMNKALEIIEAKYLFNIESKKIKAVVHPQSIIHALINYKNGASKALLYLPDMRIPISSLFFDFNSFLKNQRDLSITDLSNLQFRDIDKKKFPAISLAYEVMEIGGIAPNIFNYLNELLVTNFIRGQIGFTDIVDLNRENLERVFNKNNNILKPNYDDIININNWIDKNLYLGK